MTAHSISEVVDRACREAEIRRLAAAEAARDTTTTEGTDQ